MKLEDLKIECSNNHRNEEDCLINAIKSMHR